MKKVFCKNKNNFTKDLKVTKKRNAKAIFCLKDI